MVFSFCAKCSLKYLQQFSIYNRTYRIFKLFVNKNNCLSISATSSFSVEPCLQIYTTPVPQHAAHHTTKNWKFIARDGEGRRDVVDSSTAACEEGHGAVPHALLISELQKCTSILSQIETFCSIVSITQEDIVNRRIFSQSFDDAFKNYFHRFKVNLFGSSENGLGFKGCDTDICLQTNFKEETHVTLKDVPTLLSVIDGTVPQENVSRMTPLFMLRFVRRILREHCPDVRGHILLIKARCPLLRFYNVKYDLFCDFSCESRTSLRNTKLLRFICHLDERFAMIAKVVRYWGKYGGFVGDIDMFNSYAFSLLVVHFLQRTDPPVLPSVCEMLEKSDYLVSGSVDDSQEMLNDLKNFTPSKNTMTIDELLRKFFFYYLKYDFSRIMQPFTSSSIHKFDFVPVKDPEDIFEFATVNMQDPFRLSFNSTHGASFKSCKRFLNALLQTCEMYQDDTLWKPGTEGWGLCSLFRPPLPDSKMHERWQKNLFHSIHLPDVPDMASKLRRILEYGLLFHCTEFRTLPTTSTESTLKLHCKAYTNTWQGRNWVEMRKDSIDNPLEVEHFISTELSKRAEGRKQVLCEFDCEYTGMKEQRLQLSFRESKFPPFVAVFLKEFIPGVVRNL